MRAQRIESGLMAISIDGSSIRYSYNTGGDAYELRLIPFHDIAMLRRAESDRPRYSTSATVQYLTHKYKDRHYLAGTDKNAPKARESAASLKAKTPYRDQR